MKRTPVAAREKILVRGVNWLGDAVMTTPALRRLREAKPHAHITLLTHEKLAPLWQSHPSLDAAIAFGSGAGVFSTARRLRGDNFGTTILFPNSPRAALEAFLARVPQRIGYAKNARGWLLTQPITPRPAAVRMHKRSLTEVRERVAQNLPRETFPAAAHHVHDYLQLVASLGANPAPLPPLLSVSAEEVAAASARFHLESSAPLFGLNPGAEYGPAKRWPAERFVAAAVQLHRQTGCQWILFGGKGDVALAEEIAGGIRTQTPDCRITNVAGQTTVRELCALLKACALLLTNDTGPMHVAAALGTPVIVPFGSTSPELTGPAFTADAPHRLCVGAAPCAPCFLRECPIDFRCMRGIASAQMVEAVLDVWQAQSRTRGT